MVREEGGIGNPCSVSEAVGRDKHAAHICGGEQHEVGVREGYDEQICVPTVGESDGVGGDDKDE